MSKRTSSGSPVFLAVSVIADKDEVRWHSGCGVITANNTASP